MAEQQTFQLRGLTALASKLRRLGDLVPDLAAQALRVEAEQIMTRSKRDYVPVDLGTLKSSGHVQPVRREGKSLFVTLSYGGAASAYALAVHEHPSEHSPRSWRGSQVTYGTKSVEEIESVRGRVPWSLAPGRRGPKYLARPLMAAVPGMADRIAERVGKGVGKPGSAAGMFSVEGGGGEP